KASRMSKYRMLLLQLGEKYQGEFGEGWPVEIKILLMSVVEMIVFIALRFLLSLSDEANENTVSFICDMIDRHFGITGVRSNNADMDIKEPKLAPERTEDDNLNIDIPNPPEEANDIRHIAGWIPTITSTLGIDNVDS